MPISHDEKRRYFRINDTLNLQFEVLSEKEAVKRESEMRIPGYFSSNRIQLVERDLQLMIDKIRVKNPEFSKAIELLNTKFSLLKEAKENPETLDSRNEHLKQVSISACGICFEHSEEVGVGEKLFLNMILLPTDLQVYTLGEVVDCHVLAENSDIWTICIDFYGMNLSDEELMVQHIVKRQGQLLAASRGAH